MADTSNQRNPDSRTAAIGTAMTAVVDMLDTLTGEQWESESLCVGWRVRDVAGHLVWRVGSNTTTMMADTLALWPWRHRNPARAMDALSLRAAEAQPAALVASLRHIAAQKSAGVGRHGRGELSEVVVHGLDMAQPLGLDLGFDAAVTELVATGSTLLLTAERREALRRHRLVAADAGWSMGAGDGLHASAAAIILYLYGRTPLPDDTSPASDS